MSYIDNNLLPGETINFRTKKHIIIFLYAFTWTIFCIFATLYMFKDPILHRIVWAPWFIALLLWIYAWLEYITAEFAVTNKRVMMREGFFVRHANELRLTAISQVTVEQSLLGQLAGFGMVNINAFGAYDTFNYIAKATEFQRSVNEQLDKAVK